MAEAAACFPSIPEKPNLKKDECQLDSSVCGVILDMVTKKGIKMKISCPVCHRNYEIEDQYVGQQFDCPSCKTRFTAGVIVPAQPIEVKTNVKQGAIIGAWACLSLGVILNIISNLLFLLFSPLYLAAFILGIAAMVQRRVAGGITVLLLSVVLPPCIILTNIARFANDIKMAADDQEKKQTISVQDSPSSSKQPGVPALTIKNELEGLCGIKFGTEFPKNNNPRNGKLTSGEIMYRVNPMKKFMGFTDYYVMTTPISQKIYSIWLSQNFKESAEAREEFEKVSTILENHYKIKGEREISFDPLQTYRFDNGRIVLKCDLGFGENTLEIRAYSDEFEELNEQEKKEAAIKSTDTSAL